MYELICIKCPMGCRLKADQTPDRFVCEGNTCKKGEKYAMEEITAPQRIVTSLIRVDGAEEPVSVKTKTGIPKEMIFDCVREIKNLRLSAPISINTVLIENVLGTGVDVISTKTVRRMV